MHWHIIISVTTNIIEPYLTRTYVFANAIYIAIRPITVNFEQTRWKFFILSQMCKCKDSNQSLTFQSHSRCMMMIGLKMTIANFYISPHRMASIAWTSNGHGTSVELYHCMPINNHFTAHTRTPEPLEVHVHMQAVQVSEGKNCNKRTLSTSAYLKCIIAYLAFITYLFLCWRSISQPAFV